MHKRSGGIKRHGGGERLERELGTQSWEGEKAWGLGKRARLGKSRGETSGSSQREIMREKMRGGERKSE